MPEMVMTSFLFGNSSRFDSTHRGEVCACALARVACKTTPIDNGDRSLYSACSQVIGMIPLLATLLLL